MPQCLVASIDVGRNNLAVCVYECLRRTVVFWKNYDLKLKKYHPTTYRKRIQQLFIQLPKCDIYLVEKQVPKAPKNCLIEAIIHCLIAYAREKTPRSVYPSDVRKFFELRHDSKHFKKQDAVFVTNQVVQDSRGAAIKFHDQRVLDAYLKSTGLKKDDLADSFLQVVFWCEKNVTRREAFNPRAYKHYAGRQKKEKAPIAKPAAKRAKIEKNGVTKAKESAAAATSSSSSPPSIKKSTGQKRQIIDLVGSDDSDDESDDDDGNGDEEDENDEESSEISDSFLFTSPLSSKNSGSSSSNVKK